MAHWEMRSVKTFCDDNNIRTAGLEDSQVRRKAASRDLEHLRRQRAAEKLVGKAATEFTVADLVTLFSAFPKLLDARGLPKKLKDWGCTADPLMAFRTIMSP